MSNPSILSLSAIRASLSVFDEVGMDKLVRKSKQLTDYLLFLLDSIETDRIEIITPKERGCQISIRVKNGNKELFDKITEKGVIADWRDPDVIRVDRKSTRLNSSHKPISYAVFGLKKKKYQRY